MKTNNCKNTGIVVHCCCCLEKMAAKLGLRLSLAQLIIGLWRPWDGCCEEVYIFSTLSENFGWSLESFSFYEPAPWSNQEQQWLSFRVFRLRDCWQEPSALLPARCELFLSLKIQYAHHHPDGHVAKAWSFHTLSTEETPETEFWRIHEAELPEITSFGSGTRNQPLKMNPCANHIAYVTDSLCSMPGIIVCPSCNLVSYCSDGCRMQNWEKHRGVFHVNWMYHHLLPSRKQRNLRQMLWWRALSVYGAMFLLMACWETIWGIFHSTSGCFAASGDLRNTIETVCQLPEHFQGSLTVYLNDTTPR